MIAFLGIGLARGDAPEPDVQLLVQRGHNSDDVALVGVTEKVIATTSSAEAILWEVETGRELARTDQGVRWRRWRAAPEQDLLVGVGVVAPAGQPEGSSEAPSGPVGVVASFRLSTLAPLPERSRAFHRPCDNAAISADGAWAACADREGAELVSLERDEGARTRVSGLSSTMTSLRMAQSSTGAPILIAHSERASLRWQPETTAQGQKQDSAWSPVWEFYRPEPVSRPGVVSVFPRPRATGTGRYAWASFTGGEHRLCGVADLVGYRGVITRESLCEAEPLLISEAAGLVLLRQEGETFALSLPEGELLWRRAEALSSALAAPGGERLLLRSSRSALAPDTLTLVDARTGEPLAARDSQASQIAVGPKFALLDEPEGLLLWSYGDDVVVPVPELGAARAVGVLDSPSGVSLWARGADGAIQVWPEGAAPLRLRGRTQPVHAAWMDPRSQRLMLATQGSDALRGLDLQGGTRDQLWPLPEPVLSITPTGEGALLIGAEQTRTWSDAASALLPVDPEGCLPRAGEAFQVRGGEVIALEPAGFSALSLSAASATSSAGIDGHVPSVDNQAIRFASPCRRLSLLRWTNATSTARSREHTRAPGARRALAWLKRLLRTGTLWEPEVVVPGRTPLLERDLELLAMSEDGEQLVFQSSGTSELCSVRRAEPTRARCQPLSQRFEPRAGLAQFVLTRSGQLIGPRYDPLGFPAFSALGDMLGRARTLQVVDLASGQVERLKVVITGDASLVLSPDQQTLAVVHPREVRFIELSAGVERGHLPMGARSLRYERGGSLMLTTHEDGAVRLWDTQRSALLLTVLLFPERGWAVVDPDGRFDHGQSEPEGFHFGLRTQEGVQTLSPAQLRDHYFDPGLLRRALDPEDAVRELAPLGWEDLPPAVESTLGEDSLRVVLRDRGGGYGRVALLSQGYELSPDVRPSDWAPSGDTVSFEVPLAPFARFLSGEELLELQAFNAGDHISVRGGAAHLPKRAGSLRGHVDLYAVVVGASDYYLPELDLDWSDDDAVSVAQALRSGGSALLGAQGEDEHVRVTLISDAAPGEDAGLEGVTRLPLGKAEVLAALAQAQLAKPEDIVILYLSGHGARYEQQYYFNLPSAAPERLEDPDYRDEHALSGAELLAALTDIPARKRFVILDTCHAGDALGGHASALLSDEQRRLTDDLSRRAGTFVLAATPSDATAYERSDLQHGLLTYALLSGLQGEAQVGDGYWDTLALVRYVEESVPALSERLGMADVQRPNVVTLAETQSFTFGKTTPDIREVLGLVPSGVPILAGGQLLDGSRGTDHRALSAALDVRLLAATRDAAQGFIWSPRSPSPSWRVGGLYATVEGELRLDLNIEASADQGGLPGRRLAVRITEQRDEVEPVAECAARWIIAALRHLEGSGPAPPSAVDADACLLD